MFRHFEIALRTYFSEDYDGCFQPIISLLRKSGAKLRRFTQAFLWFKVEEPLYKLSTDLNETVKLDGSLRGPKRWLPSSRLPIRSFVYQ